MKKLLIVLLALGMLYGVTSIAAAADQTADVYLDYVVNGSTSLNIGVSPEPDDVSIPNLEYDNTGFILGGEYFLNDWKFGLEYGSGQMELKIDGDKTDVKTDFNYYDLRLGYQLLKKDNFDLYALGSLLISDYEMLNIEDIPGYYDVPNNEFLTGNLNLYTYAVILGPELDYRFNEKFSVQAFAGYSIVASDKIKTEGSGIDEDTGEPTSVSGTTGLYNENATVIKIQFSYNFNDQLQFHLGYRDYINSGKFLNFGGNGLEGDFDYDSSMSLITLGATYRF